MRIRVVTLFPELFETFFTTSLIGRAARAGATDIATVPLREFGLGKHRSVDDTPYGGGAGMVLRVEPVVHALEAVDESAREAGAASAHRILLTPQGQRFDQASAEKLSKRTHAAIVCGRYEGFDERIRSQVHEELSLGDFVLMGGEVAAMAIIEATVRLLPGALGNEASATDESFSPTTERGLEYPQFTRPVEFRGARVPEVLQSGDHGAIEAWRREQAVARTRERRPDLFAGRETEERKT